MNKNDAHPKLAIDSKLSFLPLLRVWKTIMEEGEEGAKEFISGLYSRVSEIPELLKPIEDLEIIRKHSHLVEQMMTTIFPAAFSDGTEIYAVSRPFTYDVIYHSEKFGQIFLGENGVFRKQHDEDAMGKVHMEKKAAAYQLIIKKLYNIQLNGQVSRIHSFQLPVTGLRKYVQLEVDTRFIDVVAKEKLPEIPESCRCGINRVADILQRPEIMEWLPLSNVRFEGIAIIKIRDVTEREVINNIKSNLLTLQSFNDMEDFNLHRQVQELLGIPDLTVGITPFFTVNEKLVISDLHNAGSIFLRNIESFEEKQHIVTELQQVFHQNPGVILIPDINDESARKYPFLEGLRRQEWKGILVYPLHFNGKLVGTLELASADADRLDYSVLIKMEPAIPLFELALQKSAENLETQIEKVIMEQFTAVQSSVEWRFTEAALNYILKLQQEGTAKIENIKFDAVYPLYGAIDIRNSSVQRNAAIQKDLLEQLETARSIIKKAGKLTKYPLLKQVDYKIRKLLHSVSNIVLSDEEVSINKFLKKEIVSLFEHLKSTLPEVEEDISKYFQSVNSIVDMVYHHRKDFDESITRINEVVARFFDTEQSAAQQIYPHYFERFVTDGVDYNMYVGQSICPDKPFHDFYLRNLKLWQLTTLIKASRLTRELRPELPMALETTQLILSHSFPISVSFRPAERKFDVDGAYNIRYEIIKKRIDKVRIKDSNERLTTPGKIAIVYTQPQDAEDYNEFIEFLQNEGELLPEVERYDLEELQGVAGLKALRVAINFDQQKTSDKKSSQDKLAAKMN